MSFFDSDDESSNGDGPKLSSLMAEARMQITRPCDDLLQKFTTKLNEQFHTIKEFQKAHDFSVRDPFDKQIKVADLAYENKSGVFNLVETPEKELGKIISIFSFLDNEVNKVVHKFDREMMDTLLTYGEGKICEKHDENMNAGEREAQISRIMPLLKDVFDLLKRTSFIMINVVNQLHALYYSKERFYKNTYKNIQLFFPLESLAKACGLIYKIDLILKENPKIKEDFGRYKNLFRQMLKDPSQFAINDIQLKKLEKLIVKYDKTILSGNCFIGTISQRFDIGDDPNFGSIASTKLQIKDNSELSELFKDFLKRSLENVGDLIGNNTETFERKIMFNNFCLYALSKKLFPKDEDRDLWKKIMAYSKESSYFCSPQSHCILSFRFFEGT